LAPPSDHDDPDDHQSNQASQGRRPYYGWVLVWTLGVTETISYGILLYAFGVFLAPMEQSLGWSRGALSGAFSLALLLSGIAAVPVGRWLDAHGARLLMTVGSCAGALLVLAWSAVDSLAAYYAVWAGIGISMSMVLYDPAFAVVATWFRRYRARALTIVTLLAGLASTIFVPLADWLIRVQGWRQALVTLAAILAAGTILPHALLLRRHPADLGLRVDGDPAHHAGAGNGAAVDAASGVAGTRVPAVGEAEGAAAGATGATVRDALRHGSFRWLAAAFCLHTLASTAVSVHLVPYLRERGYDPAVAAAATGAVGAAQLLGRIIFAPTGSRYPLQRVAAVALAVQPVALLVLLLAPGGGGLWSFVVLFGAGRGAMTLARPSLVAALYGASRFGRIAGVLSFLVTATQAAAPVALGSAFDALGTYDPAIWVLVGVSAAASLAVLGAGSAAARRD
jgi:MFS family permease